MTHYWFGDSWIVGDELELTVDKDSRDQYVFAKLVSDYFDSKSVNLGVSGSSVDSLPWEFSKISNQIQPGDTAFFCLTAPHRTTIINDNKLPAQIVPGPNYSQVVHPHAKEWFKFFDTESHRCYSYGRTVSLLWLWCNYLKVECFFVNLFTTPTEKLLDIVPNRCWLLPTNECLSKFIMPLNGNYEGIVISDDTHFLSNEQWQMQKEYLEKYVKPGYCHPNIQGHRVIADNIIDILKNIRGNNVD